MTTLSPDLGARDATFYDDHSVGDGETKRVGSNMSEQLPIQGATGPVGEPGLPPSRPTSGVANPQRSSIGAARKPPPPATGGGWNDSGRSNIGSSRNYVSNLTSAAFFRPMNSRKMQDERQQPPASPLAQDPEPATPRKSTETSRSRRHRHRYSNASVVTIDREQRPLVDADAPPVPPSSHGDGHTHQTLRGQESLTPLRAPDGLSVDARSPVSALRSDKSPATPRSFRQPFGALGSRNGERKPSGHRRLDSGPTTPMAEKEPSYLYEPPKDLGRNYEYYNGNAVFLLHGRLLNARQRPLNAVTAFLAILPAALFFAFSAPFLWHHVSPAIPILFAYVFWICISAYAHASFSDPGILPRNLHPHPPTATDADPLAVGPSTSDWVTVRSFAPGSASNTSTAMEVPTKYCKSCNIWRPPRAHHCRICDACIETQDHHCVWLNNCVGRRNYRQFFNFVAAGALLAFFLLGASLAHILVWMNQNHTSFGQAISHDWSQRGAFAMFIYSIFVIPYPASLCGYHLFLMARGESTREYLNSLKFLPKDRHRPFSLHNVFKNILGILGRPKTPTYMRFKSSYRPGDQRMGAQEKHSSKGRRNGSDDVEKGSHEMKEMNGHNQGGFQGPKGRLPINNSSRLGIGSSSDKA